MDNTKIWFITGASKGMGLALTKLLLSKGEKVVAASRSLADLQKSIDGNNDNFLPLQLDITSDADVKSAMKQSIDKFGKLNVVVNNAGYSLVGSLEEVTDAEFRKTVDVNLFGTVNVIRAAMPYLRQQQSGHVINISSNAGYIGFANAGSYCASKFAIIGLSEALAAEAAPFNIKVTAVAPGQFRTSFMEEGSLTFTENKIPVYKVAESETMWRSFSGQQIGDPHKLANILYDLSRLAEPPLHLLLGPDTYELVMEHRAKERQEIESWKHVTLSTNFD